MSRARRRHASLPSLAASISWSRLFVAARLLEDLHRPVGRVALHLGFASGSALRGMLKRYTGLTPGEVRCGGGLDRVIDAMCAKPQGVSPDACCASVGRCVSTAAGCHSS